MKITKINLRPSLTSHRKLIPWTFIELLTIKANENRLVIFFLFGYIKFANQRKGQQSKVIFNEQINVNQNKQLVLIEWQVKLDYIIEENKILHKNGKRRKKEEIIGAECACMIFKRTQHFGWSDYWRYQTIQRWLSKKMHVRVAPTTIVATFIHHMWVKSATISLADKWFSRFHMHRIHTSPKKLP